MRIPLSTTLAAAALALSAQNAMAAPGFNYDLNNVVTGVTGVNVNGQLFDVMFETGTCSAVFNTSCVGSNGQQGGYGNQGDPQTAPTMYFTNSAPTVTITPPNFVFATEGAAADASQALLDQAPLLDMSVNGCDPQMGYCVGLVPYGPVTAGTAEWLALTAPPGNDAPFFRTSFSTSYDYANDGGTTFAVFTAEANPVQDVPEPASVSLVLAGVGLAAAARRRRQSKGA